MNVKLDPWGSSNIDDYSKLFDEFGIQRFDELLPRIEQPSAYMRRKIIFGHRDYDMITRAMNDNDPFAVMSGFMPSGKVHLGGKMVMDQIIWHQQMGGEAFVGIADREAYSVRGFSWEKCKQIGIEEYILSLIALGFEPDGHIYFQSQSKNVKDLAFEMGVKANFSELSAIYGFNGQTNIAHMVSALSQSADILQPELEEFSGPKPTVVPAGADQDPHMRLTRGLANKMNMFLIEERRDKNNVPFVSVRSKTAPVDALEEVSEALPWDTKLFEGHVDIFGVDDLTKLKEITMEVEMNNGGYGFLPPASTYHRFMSGLQGGKMSSSVPDSLIALTDDPDDAARKVKKAKTGGCMTLKEQKELGGQPDECSVYELLVFHLSDDDGELAQIHSECLDGSRMCGSCKGLAAERMTEFLKDHQEKRELARERLEEYGL
jgi:tryptophanyl-tRNA synthetase